MEANPFFRPTGSDSVMNSNSSPDPRPITEYVEDGVRIAAIVLIWAVIGAFFSFGVGNIGGPGSLFEPLGTGLGGLFMLVGVLNAFLYIVYRGIDHHSA
jgi:hypothetical protein